MTTMKPSSIPGSHDLVSKSAASVDNPPIPSPSHVYRGTRKPYVNAVPYLQPISVADGLSVGCSTEDDWEEEAFNPPNMSHRGPRRGRGGRGRGGYHERDRQQRRRQEPGTRFIHNQYNHPQGGQSWGY